MLSNTRTWVVATSSKLGIQLYELSNFLFLSPLPPKLPFNLTLTKQFCADRLGGKLMQDNDCVQLNFKSIAFINKFNERLIRF
jgi:hypothetical protein